MARPKDKFRSQTFGDAFLDKSERERSRLKLTLAKQMQKDIGRMLDEEIHSDLTIAVGNRTIPVHRFFIKTRSKRIFGRLVELANAEPQSKLMTMPWWLDYDTLIILFHQLYNVNSVDGEIDEIDIAAGYTMVDYLLSLLSEKKPESVRRRMRRIRKEDEDMNGEETTDLEPLEEPEVLTNGVQDVHNETVTRGEEVQDKVMPQVNGVEECSAQAVEVSSDVENDKQDNKCDNCDSDNTDIVQKAAEEDTQLSDIDDVVEENPNLSELIKMSYDITVPYNTCSVLGEDLLRGFLQDLDYDCIITVSDVHFKAHRSLLTARSAYFEAMLSGSWAESDSHEIKLEGVTPGVMEQTLLYLYGGVTDLIDSCTLSELIMVADMYGLDGLRDVVLYNLRRDYCHFFHKPCSVCEEGVLITLCLTVTYNMAEMQERCTKWINNNRIKIWRTEAFARLPPEIIEICYNTAASSMDISNVIRVMMDCQRMNRTIPHLKRNETVLHYITLLMDSATEYTSRNFNHLINSPHFINLDKDLAFKIDLLEELFESVIKSLSMKTACEAYVSLTKIYNNVTCPSCYASEDFNIGEKFISSLLKMSEAFLKMHIHQVINTENWDLLPKDFQTHLLATSNFVCVEGVSKSRKAPPKLTSMLEKSSPHSDKQGATQKSVTGKTVTTSSTNVGGDPSSRQVMRPKKPLPKKPDQSTKGGQLKLRLSPDGSVESLSSRGSVSSARGTNSSTRASPTEFVPVVGNGIMLADIPLEPVDDGVAQRAILPPPIHSLEQLQPILVWEQVTQNN